MAHGFSATKEMHLDAFAEYFAAGGLNALVYDNRNSGESDGEPRGDHLTPQDLTLRAYQAALEPKRLLVLPGGHFDAYVGDAFAMSAPVQRDWFAQHLR